MKSHDWYITSEDEAQFIEYLKLTGASAISVKNWKSDLKNFVMWSRVENNPDLSSDDLLLKYRRNLLSSGSATHTINRRINTISKFTVWYLKKYDILKNAPNLTEARGAKQNMNTSSQKYSSPDKKILYGSIIGIIIIILLTVVIYSLLNRNSLPTDNYYNQNRSAINDANFIKYDGYLSQNTGLFRGSNASLVFKLYNNKEDSVPLYVGTCNSITPDKSGFFTVRIGLDCGMDPLPKDIYGSIKGIYLGISNKVSGKEIIREYISFDAPIGVSPTLIQDTSVNVFINDSAFVDIEEGLVPGDIVTRSQSGLKKAKKGDILIGVRGDNKVIVSGMADVLVSTQEGQISKGDIVAVGEVAGIGQRGILAGYDSIGVALEDYAASESGKIRVIIRPGY